MPKRSSKDLNETAYNIVQQSIGQWPKSAAIESMLAANPPIKPNSEKNPAAVALGRLGGLKGGKARAESLTAKKRSEIAKKAAISRWGKKKPLN